MSTSSVPTLLNPYLTNPHDQQWYRHQVRMEIAVDEKTQRVNVAGILKELMRRVFRHAAANVETIQFLDTNGKETTLEAFPTTDTFADSFKVTQISKEKFKKVTLGFFVNTTTTFGNFKIAVGHQWLRDQKVYLREQNLPFEYGTDLSLIGYYISEHPWFGSAQSVLDAIGKAWTEATTTPVQGDDYQRLEELARTGTIIKGEHVDIPFSVERSRMAVKAPNPDKANFSCDVWHVYVPRKYFADAAFINDLSVLEAQNLPNMIPQILAKSNPVAFYQRMTAHSRFMHEHRNITVYNVNVADFKKMEMIEVKSHKTYTSLWALMEGNETIHRVTHDQNTNSVNVSVNAKHYDQTITWLREHNKKFSFGPYIKGSIRNKSVAGTRSDRYSKVFSSHTPDDGSFDPSTIVSAKSRNPWNRAPPLELVFDVEDDEQFPKMPQKSPVWTADTADSTSLPTMVTQDVEALVAKAIADQEQRFNEQFEKLATRQKQLEESFNTLTTTINETLNALVEKTVEAMMGPNTPFFTKVDATSMLEQQNKTQDDTQAQLTQILQLLTNHTDRTGPDPAQSPPRKNPRMEEGIVTPITTNKPGTDQIMSEAGHEEVGTH